MEPGATLLVQEREGVIILKPVGENTSLAWDDGLLVYTGEFTDDLRDAVRTDRESRSRKLLRRR